MGLGLIVSSIVVLLWIFYPVIYEEAKYRFVDAATIPSVVSDISSRNNQSSVAGVSQGDVMYPADSDFGIVIPKIRANAKIVPDVDTQDSSQYQKALTQGVAHAKGTAYPGEIGNVFLFAHSGADLYEASRFNAVFYLLSKLDTGDTVYVFYQGKRYTYQVTSQERVDADNVNYMDSEKASGKKTLTLMTCWPAGTTLKRLMIVARQVE